MQSRIRDLQERLADPALYARDRAAFTAATTALAAAQAELATAEEKWLELEMLREDIEGALTRTSSHASVIPERAPARIRDPGPQTPLTLNLLGPGYSPAANSGMTVTHQYERGSPSTCCAT